MKPTPIATPVKAFEAIAPATNLKPITNSLLIIPIGWAAEWIIQR